MLPDTSILSQSLSALRTVSSDMMHIFFPHLCAGCGNDALGNDAVLCVQCLSKLPVTNFHLHAQNRAERIFAGRLPIEAASSFMYFSKDSLAQRLLHQLKYKGNTSLGYMLGRMMGEALRQSSLYDTADILVPLPLHPSKEKKRGYNQSLVLCTGMSEAMGIPVEGHAVAKLAYTGTQTRKNRLERWQNVKEKFVLTQPQHLQNKYVLLVDDVITTGATLEACGQEILQAPGTRLGIASLAYTVK